MFLTSAPQILLFASALLLSFVIVSLFFFKRDKQSFEANVEEVKFLNVKAFEILNFK
jgi:hypothetical protein